jgi:hypothetical protein
MEEIFSGSSTKQSDQVIVTDGESNSQAKTIGSCTSINLRNKSQSENVPNPGDSRNNKTQKLFSKS